MPALLCGRRSKRVHSRYGRTLADLPWGEYAVTIRLNIRRLFCDNAQCERRLFAERLPGLAGVGSGYGAPGEAGAFQPVQVRSG